MAVTDGASFLGFGAGLRTQHYNHIFQTPSLRVDWFEAISENYFGLDQPGGRPLENLLRIRERFPVVLHGVSLSLGSTDPLDKNYLKTWKELVSIVQPAWISDHLCWGSVHGRVFHDLLPLPYTEETLDHLVPRIQEVQDYMGRPLTIENVSSYLSFTHSEMSEWDFLSELVKRSGAELLLDVNNVYVSSVNHSFSAIEYLNAIPRHKVRQIHLAGHSSAEQVLIDTHDHPVCDEVWALYAEAIRRFGAVSTMVEWDARIPDFPVLEDEVLKAKKIFDDIRSIKTQGGMERAQTHTA
jgi:uncharacterized protein (UPF0276 family)